MALQNGFEWYATKQGEKYWDNVFENIHQYTQERFKRTFESKKIRRFPSGAVRSDNTGRERPDYISPYSIKAIGEHFANNKNDFGAINYFKGIPETAVLESVYRHYLDLQIAILEGDTERIREDWKALAANCIMGLHTHEIIRLGLYKEVFEKTELINIEENDSTI